MKQNYDTTAGRARRRRRAIARMKLRRMYHFAVPAGIEPITIISCGGDGGGGAALTGVGGAGGIGKIKTCSSDCPWAGLGGDTYYMPCRTCEGTTDPDQIKALKELYESAQLEKIGARGESGTGCQGQKTSGGGEGGGKSNGRDPAV